MEVTTTFTRNLRQRWPWLEPRLVSNMKTKSTSLLQTCSEIIEWEM